VDPADRNRLEGMHLAVVVERHAHARFARGACGAEGRRAVSVDDAGLARGRRAGAGWIGAGVAAVPDPAAGPRVSVAFAGPREERVGTDLPFELDLTGLDALGTDVPGGHQAHVRGIDVDERVLVVGDVIAREIAGLVDLGETHHAMNRHRVRDGRAVGANIERRPFGIDEHEHVEQIGSDRHRIAATSAGLGGWGNGIIAVERQRPGNAPEPTHGEHQQRDG